MEILALLSGLLQAGTGIWQAFKSDELADEERPSYTVPKEVEQSLNIAKQQAYGTMPGYELAKRNIEQQQATQLNRVQNVAGSGSDVLGAASGMNLATNRAMGGLDARNEMYQQQSLARLQNSLLNRGAYTEKEFMFNEFEPYKSSQAASAVMGEGAIQNIAGGVGASMTNYMSYKQNEKLIDALLNPSTKQPTQSGTGQSSYWDNILLQQLYSGSQKKPYDTGTSFDPYLNMIYGQQLYSKP